MNHFYLISSFSEIFENVSRFKVPDILEGIWFTAGHKLKSITIPNTVTFLPYYPGIRAELDLQIPDNIEEITFVFNKAKGYYLDVQLDDDFWNTWRPLTRQDVKNLFGLGNIPLIELNNN